MIDFFCPLVNILVGSYCTYLPVKECTYAFNLKEYPLSTCSPHLKCPKTISFLRPIKPFPNVHKVAKVTNRKRN